MQVAVCWCTQELGPKNTNRHCHSLILLWTLKCPPYDGKIEVLWNKTFPVAKYIIYQRSSAWPFYPSFQKAVRNMLMDSFKMLRPSQKLQTLLCDTRSHGSNKAGDTALTAAGNWRTRVRFQDTQTKHQEGTLIPAQQPQRQEPHTNTRNTQQPGKPSCCYTAHWVRKAAWSQPVIEKQKLPPKIISISIPICHAQEAKPLPSAIPDPVSSHTGLPPGAIAPSCWRTAPGCATQGLQIPMRYNPVSLHSAQETIFYLHWHLLLPSEVWAHCLPCPSCTETHLSRQMCSAVLPTQTKWHCRQPAGLK